MNYILVSKTYDPYYNLALEKCLQNKIEKGNVILYLWINDKTIVIGRNQNVLKECNLKHIEEDRVFIARRTTGGGAVYHDLGNLCFTFLASPEVYGLKRQLSVVQNALRHFGVETEFSGRNDLITREGYKFSGNAFSYSRACNVQHGTLMVDVDVEKLGRYLTPSVEKLKAKGVASVRSRVCNLREAAPQLTVFGLIEILEKCFVQEYGDARHISPACMEGEELRRTCRLYQSGAWIYGDTLSCAAQFHARFDWGEVDIQMDYEQLKISGVKVYTDALDVELPRALESILAGRNYDLSDLEYGENITDDEKISDVVKWLKSVRVTD